MRRDENGYIVVESITCYILFTFLMISILSLINIVAVQSRVHYAITQAAETVSMYSYTLDAMGLASHVQASAGRSERTEKQMQSVQSHLNEVMDEIESLNLSGAIDAAGDTYDEIYGIVDNAVDNPKSLLQDFMNYGIQQAGGYAFANGIVKPLVKRYLTNGELSADQFLKAFHVIDGMNGLEFYDFDPVSFDRDSGRFTSTQSDDSVFLTSDGYVKVTVQYDINYTFGALPLPFSKFHVVQEVKTKAWLGGLGEGYKYD